MPYTLSSNLDDNPQAQLTPRADCSTGGNLTNATSASFGGIRGALNLHRPNSRRDSSFRISVWLSNGFY